MFFLCIFFPKKNGIKATPYGIYDIANNRGFDNVGISADPAVFAGKSILKWWTGEGKSFFKSWRINWASQLTCAIIPREQANGTRLNFACLDKPLRTGGESRWRALIA